MRHIAFHITLRPGTGPDYDRLHRKLPSVLFRQLEDATVSEYLIFRDQEHVFAFIRFEDSNRFQQAMSKDPCDPEFDAWATEVRKLFALVEVDQATNFQRALPEVFAVSPSNPPPATTEGGTE